MSRVGSYISNNSSFSSINYGYKKLGDLIRASELFDIEMRKDGKDETRFVIVKRTNSEVPENEINKASMKFEANHKRGSLATILNVMSDCKLNLTKIQSLPIVETPWKYAFFVDVTFESYDDFKKAKSIIDIMGEEFKVLGEYKNAKL
jgi:prephenate dehydratase